MSIRRSRNIFAMQRIDIQDTEPSKGMDAAGKCVDLVSLSSFLGFAPQHLYSLVSAPQHYYRAFRLPKMTGGYRRIYCPRTSLRGVQRAILDKILLQVPTHGAAHAYIKGRSALSCAKELSGKNYFLKMDIRNFFPTITAQRVFGLYRSFGFNTTTAYLLTTLTTFRNHAIQGAPTSPCISNLIAKKMDFEMETLANTFDIQYVRYSDDLFFVSSRSVGWKTFAKLVTKVIADNGFCPNKKKTHSYRKGQPKFALGFKIDADRPTLRRQTRRQYRAMFHKASMNPSWARESYDRLQGAAAWYKAVNGLDDTYREYRAILTSIQKLKVHEPYST